MKAKDTTLTDLKLISQLGEFDLDPCAFSKHLTAKNLIVLPENGLKKEWSGRVWLNPPYSEPKKWLEKLSEHGKGTALILASVETKWFQDLVFKKAHSILFIRGRPLFFRSDFTKIKLMRPTVLASYGEEDSDKLKNSGIIGTFIKLK